MKTKSGKVVKMSGKDTVDKQMIIGVHHMLKNINNVIINISLCEIVSQNKTNSYSFVSVIYSTNCSLSLFAITEIKYC